MSGGEKEQFSGQFYGRVVNSLLFAPEAATRERKGIPLDFGENEQSFPSFIAGTRTVCKFDCELISVPAKNHENMSFLLLSFPYNAET